MTDAPNGLPSGHAEPWFPESQLNVATGQMGMAAGENRNELRMEDGVDLGGHTLLSRPSAPQGRRSLFRR
jgi:hypothetical protein